MAYGVTHPPYRVVVLVCTGAISVVLGIGACVYRLRAYINLHGDVVTWRKIVRGGSFRRSEVATRLYWEPLPGALDADLLMLDADGRLLVKLWTRPWTAESVDRLAAFVEGPGEDGRWLRVDREWTRKHFPHAGVGERTARAASRLAGGDAVPSVWERQT